MKLLYASRVQAILGFFADIVIGILSPAVYLQLAIMSAVN